MSWPLAFASCLSACCVGDFIVYFLGYFYGEKVLSLPLTRKFLTRAREAQIKGYFHRHGFKILILGRFAVGFRTAAYLTAGILKLPPSEAVPDRPVRGVAEHVLMFGLGYVFADQIQSGHHRKSSTGSPWRSRLGAGGLAALPLLQGPAAGRAAGRAPRARRRRRPAAARRPQAYPDDADGEIDSLLETKPPSLSIPLARNRPAASSARRAAAQADAADPATDQGARCRVEVPPRQRAGRTAAEAARPDRERPASGRRGRCTDRRPQRAEAMAGRAVKRLGRTDERKPG